MTDEQNTPERHEFLTGWNLPSILYLLLAFYALLGFLGALWLKDFHAAAWAVVTLGLSLVVCDLKRGSE